MTQLPKKFKQQVDQIGETLVTLFHLIALFAIGGAIAWSAALAFIEMKLSGSASIEDILTLFIYLELGAMVGIYFKTLRMPVRFLLYVAITALTRMMIGSINENHTPDMGIIYIAVSIFIMAVAVLVVKYASTTFPSGFIPEEQMDMIKDQAQDKD